MSLSKKQQNYIKKKYKTSSASKIAKTLNIDFNEVEEYISSIKKKTPFYFYIIMFLIPVIILGILETCLRGFDYGYNFNQWIPVTKDRLGLNTDIGRKYFNKSQTLPESIQDTFYKEKKDSTFRIFVLGGSSAAGYPFMPLGSFSRYIRQRLEHVYPCYIIEVVNISLTATNSYTTRDFIPGVLEQKPDLILIYAGHNEYYGALGVGSMESLGTSRDMVNLILYLNNYRTTQLVRDFISWTIGLLGGNENKKAGTLMSRMAEDQSIPFNSDVYKSGIEQFEENMRDIVEMINGKRIPLIISNLVSNIKDQQPFISKKSNQLPSAEQIYSEAKTKLANEKFIKADSLFRYAKDLDLLRFRAPEMLNNVIKELSNEYNFSLVNIDSVFKSNCPDGIIGDNLMTDHLHPTLRGHQLIGKAFYDEMILKNYLPPVAPIIESSRLQDSITVSNYLFSKLDSTLADYKIKSLKNDWPYLKDRKNKISSDKLLNPENKIDSLAYRIVVNDEAYIDIQQDAANFYLRQNDLKKYMNHVDILIHQYPIIREFYKKAANDLMTRNRYDEALKYLSASYNKSPDAFSAKWLGIITLSKNNNETAINYLKESLSYESNDEQVLYNLAGAYSRKKNYKDALSTVNKALEINPNYPSALNLKAQLEKVLENM
ncbi:MAG: tetratricopeptide repeat protein [Ignavibacteria bacterium]